MKSTIWKTICVAAFLCSLPAFAQRVVLTWIAPPVPACGPVTGYNIYRSDTSNGETLASRIGGVVAPNLTYTDTTVLYGKTYFYKLDAEDNSPGCNGTKSIFSNEASAVIPLQIIIQSPALQPAQIVIP